MRKAEFIAATNISETFFKRSTEQDFIKGRRNDDGRSFDYDHRDIPRVTLAHRLFVYGISLELAHHLARHRTEQATAMVQVLARGTAEMAA